MAKKDDIISYIMTVRLNDNQLTALKTGVGTYRGADPIPCLKADPMVVFEMKGHQKNMDNRYTQMIPFPIVDNKEEHALIELQEKYDKLVTPSILAQIGSSAAGMLPYWFKNAAGDVIFSLSESQFMSEAMKVAGDGFKTLEKRAAQMTISEKAILKALNKKSRGRYISSLKEVCFMRAYDVEKLVSKYKTSDVLTAAIEGAVTGAAGFAGIVPNFVFSTFLYFRAVQSVAMCYGYDVKTDPSEMEIASAVFMNSLNPGSSGTGNELNVLIGKYMVFNEMTVIRQTAKKTWDDMVVRGGSTLFIAQMRALANKAAEKALRDAGEKGLEQSVFRGILEQIGKKASLEATGRAVPAIGGFFGALFDTSQMNKNITFADVFYRKRFIEEKEERIKYFLDAERV